MEWTCLKTSFNRHLFMTCYFMWAVMSGLCCTIRLQFFAASKELTFVRPLMSFACLCPWTASALSHGYVVNSFPGSLVEMETCLGHTKLTHVSRICLIYLRMRKKHSAAEQESKFCQSYLNLFSIMSALPNLPLNTVQHVFLVVPNSVVYFVTSLG